MFGPVAACPLCARARAELHSQPRANLYSEKLAALAGVDEARLLEDVQNVQCARCGLIYKRNWFDRELLCELFSTCVPSHPKGWDVQSDRFSAQNFQREVDAYEAALADSDHVQIARYKRALASIIDSVTALEGSGEADELFAAIDQEDVASLKSHNEMLKRTMNEPAPYKRFSGFSASGLWGYIDARVGPVEQYGEVGCPLWGLLPRAVEKGVNSIYFRRPEPNYWGKGCRNNGVHCVDHLIAETGVETRDWADSQDTKLDAIGVFQYLDHIEDPNAFITELFDHANAAAIILDTVDQPVAIQHFTGWTAQAIEWLANQYGCRVHSDFEEIRQSGNVLYLLEKG